MRLRHILSEAPISGWEVSSNFDDREKTMQDRYKVDFEDRPDKFYHYTKADKAAIRDEGNITRAKLAFEKMPAKINLFFYHHDKPNYDPFLQKGKVDIAWVTRVFGKEAADEIKQWFDPDAINVVMTNNRADNHPVSLKSQWMLAHRIAHAVAQGDKPSHTNGNARLNDIVETLVYDVLTTAYGYDLDFSAYGRNAFSIRDEVMNILGTELGKALGTFKSARDGTLVQITDWGAEMFTQWMLTGKVTFNKLPNLFDGRHLTTDPTKLRRANLMIRNATTRFGRIFSAITENAKGHIWVM